MVGAWSHGLHLAADRGARGADAGRARADLRHRRHGAQTGYFIYDVWDINAGLDGGHLTLANGTGTDIFCSSQVVLPQGGQVFIAGGDNWTGTGTTNTGNNNSNLFDLPSNTLSARQQHEPRALVLRLDRAAERRDLHPGRLRRHRPPRDPRRRRHVPAADRRRHQRARLHVPAQLHRARRPRVRLRQRRAGCTTSTPSGTGAITTVGQFASAYAAATPAPRCSGRAASCSSAATRTARSSSTSTAARRSSRRRSRCRRSAGWSTPRSWPTARCSPPAAATVWNEMTGVNNSAEIWNPDDRHVDARRRAASARACTTRRGAAARRERAGRRRRRAGAAEQH